MAYFPYDDPSTLREFQDIIGDEGDFNHGGVEYGDPYNVGDEYSLTENFEGLSVYNPVPQEPSHGLLEETVREIPPESVRWFYKPEGDREWRPFMGFDSINLETGFRAFKRRNSLLHVERGFIHDDIDEVLNRHNRVRTDPEDMHYHTIDDKTYPECREHPIQVRGGMYEVDFVKWTCSASYWSGESCPVERGTWFYDGTWIPIVSQYADHIEYEHMRVFEGSQHSNVTHDPAGNVEVVNRLPLEEFHVDWLSPSQIHLFGNSGANKLLRSVGLKFGFQKAGGQQILRGFHTKASYDDRPIPIGHIVFVVHGIGHKMDTGRIVRNCATFRETMGQVRERFSQNLHMEDQRVEFFPVEWRSATKLDGGIVDDITPHKLLQLREMLNATAMDIMYYTSPLYKEEIQTTLLNELNRIYVTFTQRHPTFEERGGKVSVLAHSLGVVITYDIVTGVNFSPPHRLTSADGLCDMFGRKETSFLSFPPRSPPLTSDTKLGRSLLFKIENFFCVGSPLSVFLALRWRSPSDPSIRHRVLPPSLCKRLYNIYHPSDPVAYRLEPLLNPIYKRIAPLLVESYGIAASTGINYNRLPKELIRDIRKGKEKKMDGPMDPEELQKHFFNPATQFAQQTSPKQLQQTPEQKGGENNWGIWNLMKSWKGSDLNVSGRIPIPNLPSMPTVGSNHLNEPFDPLDPSNHLGMWKGESSTGKGNFSTSPPTFPDEPIADDHDFIDLYNIENDLEVRLDYILKESHYTAAGYFSALTSHTSYWSSPDVAFFVLSQLYGRDVN